MSSININTSTLPVNSEKSIDSIVSPVVSVAAPPVVSVAAPPVVSVAAPPVVSVAADPVVLEELSPVVLEEPPQDTPIVPEISSLYNNINENKKKFELPSAPPYSCLKGSSIPTYRQWKKNTRKNFKFKDDIPINTVNNMDILI